VSDHAPSSVGVVIPVYRVEEFVADAVGAVHRQTRRPDQVVLVDDHGGDRSVEIAEETATRLGLPVQIVDHGRNRGLAAARNTGLAHLDTDLVWFLDSDDLADDRFLEIMVGALVREDAAFSMCRTARVGADGAMRGVVEPAWSSTRIDGAEFARRLLQTRVRGYACNKVFRRDVLGVDPFPTGIAYEDIGPALRYGLAARTVAMVDDPLYRYRVNDGSISQRFGAHTADLFAVDEQLAQILREHDLTGRDWRRLATVFRYEGVILPVANMASRALDAPLEAERSDVAYDAVARARERIRMGDLAALLACRRSRLAVAAAVLALSPTAYRRVLRSR